LARCFHRFGAIAVVCVAVLLVAGSGPAYGEDTVKPGTPDFGTRFKARWLAQDAVKQAEAGFREAPVVTWLAGWNFSRDRWELNEYMNQMMHRMVGGLTNRLMGVEFTLCLALGIEIWQLVVNDNYTPKAADRARDIAFYVIL